MREHGPPNTKDPEARPIRALVDKERPVPEEQGQGAADLSAERRWFLRSTVLGLLGAGVAAGGLYETFQARPGSVPPERARRGLIRPPGSLPEKEFLARCIRCQRCSEVCEPNAIRLLGPGAGHKVETPYIIPEVRACTLCLKCGEACPTGAIAHLQDKKMADMGEAVVDKRLCVSHNGTGICGACFTICPLHGKAIIQGIHNRPTVDANHCVGCGRCEEACIVKGDKAIRVISQRRWL